MTSIKPWAARALATLLACSTVLLGSAVRAQDVPQRKLPTVNLVAGMHSIAAEVARTPLQRQIGMMMRTAMAPHEGMLFVFEDAQIQCFWMRNTLLPLSAAFIADDGTIVNIVDMQPRTDDSHCSTRPVRYVLEMNQGWFAKRGLKAGFKLRGQPFSK